MLQIPYRKKLGISVAREHLSYLNSHVSHKQRAQPFTTVFVSNPQTHETIFFPAEQSFERVIGLINDVHLVYPCTLLPEFQKC